MKNKTNKKRKKIKLVYIETHISIIIPLIIILIIQTFIRRTMSPLKAEAEWPAVAGWVGW